MTEISAPGGVDRGGSQTGERETDILDDEEDADTILPAFVDPSSAAVGRLSSDETGTGLQGRVRMCASPSPRDLEWQRVLHAPLDYSRYIPEARDAVVNGGHPAPYTPPRGTSSREAVLRVALGDTSSLSELSQEEELSLSTDMEESIEQLNQLILDLDPTFVPVPTRSTPLSRSASLHSNGLSPGGQGHKAGWQQKRQASDATSYSFFNGPSFSDSRMTINSSVNGGSPLPSQLGSLYKMDSVDFRGQNTAVIDSYDVVPSTPAFPVSPPTPYVKQSSEFSQLKSMRQRESSRASEDSLSFMDSMSHAGSTEAELFRADLCRTPDSCQGMFNSRTTGSSSSPLPHTDSSTPPPSSLRSPFPPRQLTPLSHSSPRGGPTGLGAPPELLGEMGESNLSSLPLGNGSLLEHSLLEAMEGLGGLRFGLGLGPDDLGLPPLLPEKRTGSKGGELHSHSPSFSGFSSPHSDSSLSIPFSSPEPLRGLSRTSSPGYSELSGSRQDTVKFVQDTSKFWYKPDISRDQAITLLKDKEPGSFIVRDSHSFRGAYGLAMKVATPPPSVLQQSKKGDPSNELVRHFLIECTQKGVRLKGCPNEPYFGSLTALVCQHSITPLALPCKLILPDKDPMEELHDSSPQTASNSAAELLKQGAACNVWYLGSVELESLTGHQAVQKATSQTLVADPQPTSTVVHFKVSAQGITLTDNQRKLFFRRHYTVNTVIFCSLDPQARKWTREGGSPAKIFGFVARKSQSGTENICHLFAEHDPEQPASAIVNFVSKVMIGSLKK
ncbi:tensin-3-like [Gadus chalcogrammus]|uniref:tensin-3-like n=1 Tax=Gadus chalcogrammus TaxID=1042646 RepID=UPI0024C4959F|nr:tensin-3-like [Gadus chalcogrammus]XP_056459802.1 tensin-3-like [Gadus chalcogrammus]